MYTDRKTTPLAFHKFIKCFSLPVSILACIAMFVAGIVNESALAITFSIPLIVFNATAFVGFLKWRYYGIVCFFCGAVLAIIFELIAVSDGGGNAVIVALSSLVYLCTIAVYYSKRKNLFDKQEEINACKEAGHDSFEENSPEGSVNPNDNNTEHSACAESVDYEPDANADTASNACLVESNRRTYTQRMFVKIKSNPFFVKYCVIGVVFLVIGLLIGASLTQAKISEQATIINEYREKDETDRQSKYAMFYEGRDEGYEAGFDAGRSEKDSACNESYDYGYEKGYNDAKKDARSSVSIYIAMLQDAVYRRDKQTQDFLFSMDTFTIIGE